VSSTANCIVNSAASNPIVVVPVKVTSSFVWGSVNLVSGIFSNITEKAVSSISRTTILFENSSNGKDDGNQDCSLNHKDCNSNNSKENQITCMQQNCKDFLHHATSNIASFFIHVISEINIDKVLILVLGLNSTSRNILPHEQNSTNGMEQSVQDRLS